MQQLYANKYQGESEASLVAACLQQVRTLLLLIHRGTDTSLAGNAQLHKAPQRTSFNFQVPLSHSHS